MGNTASRTDHTWQDEGVGHKGAHYLEKERRRDRAGRSSDASPSRVQQGREKFPGTMGKERGSQSEKHTGSKNKKQKILFGRKSMSGHQEWGRGTLIPKVGPNVGGKARPVWNNDARSLKNCLGENQWRRGTRLTSKKKKKKKGRVGNDFKGVLLF